MRLTLMALAVAGVTCAPARLAAQRTPTPPIVGRWDITVLDPRGAYPSWLEVKLSGVSTLVGQFVGRFGSARPVSRVYYAKGLVRFGVPPQWERRKDAELGFTGRIAGDRIQGNTTTDDGRRVTWSAVRAPKLKRASTPVWGDAIELFNGRDLAGWHPRFGQAASQWRVRNGILANLKGGADVVTDRKFTDFKLLVEFRYPKGSNSGIYLRGRYEVQIEDDFAHPEDAPGTWPLGGIYGFTKPVERVSKRPGEWQTVEITLIGRKVTVVLNGQEVVDRYEIPGITGGALDSKEGEPGPIFIQGDHGPVEFRKITITQAR